MLPSVGLVKIYQNSFIYIQKQDNFEELFKEIQRSILVGMTVIYSKLIKTFVEIYSKRTSTYYS